MINNNLQVLGDGSKMGVSVDAAAAVAAAADTGRSLR